MPKFRWNPRGYLPLLCPQCGEVKNHQLHERLLVRYGKQRGVYCHELDCETCGLLTLGDGGLAATAADERAVDPEAELRRVFGEDSSEVKTAEGFRDVAAGLSDDDARIRCLAWMYERVSYSHALAQERSHKPWKKHDAIPLAGLGLALLFSPVLVLIAFSDDLRQISSTLGLVMTVLCSIGFIVIGAAAMRSTRQHEGRPTHRQLTEIRDRLSQAIGHVGADGKDLERLHRFSVENSLIPALIKPDELLIALQSRTSRSRVRPVDHQFSHEQTEAA